MFRYKAAIIGSIAAVAAIITWIIVVGQNEYRMMSRQKNETERYNAILLTSLELALQKRYAVFTNVNSFIDYLLTSDDQIIEGVSKTHLNKFVGSQVKPIPGIQSVSIAPKGIQEWVFPVKGNEAILGHDLFHDPYPDQPYHIQSALKTGEVITSAPYPLRQGGLGIVMRQALYKDEAVWGMLSMVIDLSSLLQATNIQGTDARFIAGLRSQKGDLFWGENSAFWRNSVVSRFNLPGGYWEVGVSPSDFAAKQKNSQMLLFKTAFAIFLIVIVVLLYFLISRQGILSKEVARKTSAAQGSEARLRGFAESASDWFWESDANNVFTYCSERYFEITGFDPNDLQHFDYRVLNHPGANISQAKGWKQINLLIDQRKSFKYFEYQTIRANRDIIHISVSGTPVFDKVGKFIGYRGTGVDVTARKKAEEINRTYAELFNKWKTSNFIGIAQCDAVGNLIDGNDTLLSMIGYDRRELEESGLNWTDLTAAEFKNLDKRAIREARRLGYWAAYEKELIHKDGHRISILSGGSQYNAQPIEFIEFVLDITQQKKNESILADATERAEAATIAKSEFLAAMSHEIRTPMSGIVGMAKLLVEGDLMGDQKNWAENVYSSGQTLLKILNQILDQSKLEAKKLEISPLDFHLPTLIREIADLFEPNISSKGLSLTLNLSENIPPFVNADRMRIGQILSNFLSNALKFTEKGDIGIKVTHGEDENGIITLYFAISDSGIGLTEDEISRLFVAFSQADGSTSRVYGGTGLGLSISQQLAILMGGEVHVQSVKGRGSTFFFSIKCQHASKIVQKMPLPPKPEKWQSSRSLRVLLADDNEINQQLIEAIFFGLDHTLTIVGDGEAVIKHMQDQDFDVILMDVRMPKIDGLEATKVIRQMEGEKSRIPIIAITADLSPGNYEKYLSAGMDDVCVKPIEVSEILKAINRQFNEEIHTPQCMSVGLDTKRASIS